MPSPELEVIEVELLLEGIQRHYGHDLRSYSWPSLLRRLRGLVREEGLPSVSALQARVLHEPVQMEKLFGTVARHPTPLFDDPGFYTAFREQVVPTLRTHPTVRVWVAACGTGEAAWALAMLLDEEGILGRCRIYATDASEELLEVARSGVISAPPGELDDRYRRSGGKGELGHHLTLEAGRGVVRPGLRANLFFAQHNLATDGAFNEFNVVLCRDVLLYFNRSLHNRIHGRLYESLGRFGVLGLGRKESLAMTPHAADFEALAGEGRLFPEALVSYEVLAIGCGRGALHGVEALLRALPSDWVVTLAIACEREPGDDGLLSRLADCARRPVVEPDDKDEMVPGTVYLAPQGYHLVLEPGSLALACDSVKTPSFEALFQSAADSYGAAAIGVRLLSHDPVDASDGLVGLSLIEARGGLAVGELSLDRIASFLDAARRPSLGRRPDRARVA